VKDLVANALGGLSYGRLLANVASYFIIGLGVIAALNQIGVATTVTMPVLIAVLATIAGILIVGVGGGLVRPMQSRWESWLARAASESQTIAEHAKAYSASQRDMQAATTPPAQSAPERTQPVYATGHVSTAAEGPATGPAVAPTQPVAPSAESAAPPAVQPAPSAVAPTPTPGPGPAPGHSRQPAPPTTATTRPDNPQHTWPISEQPTQVIPPTTPPER
jgi:hypothetical protein